MKMFLACLLVMVWTSGLAAPEQTEDGSESRQRGVVTPAKLISKVDPKYPEEARRKGVSGTVRLFAIIRKDGTVGSLKVISGDSFLTQAAIDAVQQWRYTPCLLNGEPVEVDTKIEVGFELSKKPQEPKNTQ